MKNIIDTENSNDDKVKKIRAWVYRLLADLETTPVLNAEMSQTGLYQTTIKVNFGREV